jgi:phage gp29-like protein
MSITLDALFFGYSLVSLGDIKDSKFSDLHTVRRWLVSPDRLTISNNKYSIDGVKFLDDTYKNWYIYVPTTNQLGTSKCGVGLLYLVGLYEIFLRNNMGYNADYVEMFSQPYRIGRTDKTDSDERDRFEETLANMGSSGYALMDNDGDSIEFLETSNATGYQGYDNLEVRLEKKISKLILGHSDALDSIPGQLGNVGGNDNPVYLAMLDKKTKDGIFVKNIVNTELLTRMRKLGFDVPVGSYFDFKNDDENNKSINFYSDIASKMADGGLAMLPSYFEDKTGIKTTNTDNGGV